ncbi:nucleotidyl transferase AbiEii/AbiGii toxin family protein [Dactylosporangium aurantiacum]|uniref:nucleotidyl transferase AbiEii/AbiGii toxin family protein n=1 Tax=Dactylosporangium aurantiacum TaxID=35754 RepID=UPI0006948198|nr:nucleotidyl transferase AbiEii/AbiGii toxin family protein [Dactylosporangium aurantiacum]MDG6101848.1 nucleotidyl transferase AbiEii/AbiGii toxin family protein [Dactylosporangium aurantiacum]
MTEIAGTFEIHLTAGGSGAQDLADLAARHGVRFVHIVLDQGRHPSQPMLTVPARGTLDEVRALARQWRERLVARGTPVTRVKIEAAPWCAGVPQDDAAAAAEPPGRYFEHHVKLLLPAAAPVAAMRVAADAGAAYGARLSRNARRRDGEGRQERFLTARCHGVGLATATARLDAFVATLRGAGLEVVEVEQEYVVDDSNLGLDRGWLDGRPDDPVAGRHPPAAGETTVADEDTVAGEGTGRRRARRAALEHVLGVLTRSRWAEHLVLRGSVTMAAWVGEAAREPGDLDYVVTPAGITGDSPQARELLAGVTAALAADPGAGLRPQRTTRSAIRTYERTDGHRLTVPFQVPGAPAGAVQIDLAFGEHLPLAPEPLTLPGIDRPVLAAPAPLALAWKLRWLCTERCPKGKDLYDATLLAEHTTVDLALVRGLLRGDLGPDADTFTAERVLSLPVDWPGRTDGHPGVDGTAEDWRWRLALALERHWSLTGRRVGRRARLRRPGR